MTPHNKAKDVKTFEKSFFTCSIEICMFLFIDVLVGGLIYWKFGWFRRWVCKSDYSQFFLFKVEVDWNALNTEEKSHCIRNGSDG